MARDNVVTMAFQPDPKVVYFRTGGKLYLLRIPQRSGRPSGGHLAPVVVINHSTLSEENGRLITAVAQTKPTTDEYHVLGDALKAGLAPDNLPSVE